MATAVVSLAQETVPEPSVSILEMDTREAPTTISNPKKQAPRLYLASKIEELGTAEADGQLKQEGEAAPQPNELIENVLAVGRLWQAKRQTASAYFQEHKHEVLQLRQEFGVKQGARGKKLNIPEEGGNFRAMHWSEFVRLAFGVSERHVNRLLGLSPQPKSPDPVKSKSYKLGFTAGQESILNSHAPAPPSPQIVSKLDKQDPYGYFEQFKVEKQTFICELAAMVVEIYDPTDAEEVVKALLKEVRLQLAAMRKASIKSTKD